MGIPARDKDNPEGSFVNFIEEKLYNN
jgi:hypothetical protein